MAAPPDYDAREITSFTGDDGQEITGIRWTPDGQSLIFVRGGAPNGGGELPNPISNPAGVERAIWRAYLDGTGPVRLAEGYGPEPSPDGRSIAFGAKGEAWLLALDGAKPEPTSILKGRGGIGSLTWSPDGGKIAFVSDRGDHAFVGVLHIASKEVVWLGPGVDEDGSPAWSPDGAHVAFVRVPSGSFRGIFRARREDTPWSIHVGDASSGETKEIFRADEGVGSAYWPTASRAQLIWTDGGRIVFPWEKDGWLHLYSISASGGGPELLTPGAFEVEETVADGNEIVFTSNQDDIDRRHIWRVPAKGGKPKAITRGDGIEWSPAPLSDDNGIAILRSDAQMPARPAIKLGNGKLGDLAPESM
ncbi:MAG: DPP IV N-terminal domain-containing protein, partial [Candidatus Hydrogenedentota bacterium]